VEEAAARAIRQGSKAQSLLNLRFLESYDHPLTNNDRRKSTTGGQLPDFVDYFGLIVFWQQVHVGEFVLDPAITEKLLAGFAVATGA
jgi:hypothetical protein